VIGMIIFGTRLTGRQVGICVEEVPKNLSCSLCVKAAGVGGSRWSGICRGIWYRGDTVLMVGGEGLIRVRVRDVTPRVNIHRVAVDGGRLCVHKVGEMRFDLWGQT
jgi:hypothetical protein